MRIRVHEHGHSHALVSERMTSHSMRGLHPRTLAPQVGHVSNSLGSYPRHCLYRRGHSLRFATSSCGGGGGGGSGGRGEDWCVDRSARSCSRKMACSQGHLSYILYVNASYIVCHMLPGNCTHIRYHMSYAAWRSVAR